MSVLNSAYQAPGVRALLPACAACMLQAAARCRLYGVPTPSALPPCSQFAFEWGATAGPGALDFPLGVAVNRDRTKVFVCDAANSRCAGPPQGPLCQLCAALRPAAFAAPSSQHPSNPASSSSANPPTTPARRVAVFNPDTGDFLLSIGSQGDGPGQFITPVNVALSPLTGNIYVTGKLAAASHTHALTRPW